MFQPTASQVRALLPFDALIAALRAAFVAGAHVPLRHTHTVRSGGAEGISLIMPAWDDEGYYGVKIVNIYAGNHARNLPGLHSTYVLHDGASGVPIALLDGNEITSRRTAAAAALGADLLARRDARRLLVVGAGRVGRLVAPAMSAVRELEHIAIWNRNPAGAEACAQELRAAGLPAQAVVDLEAAVRAADIVSCATLASAPVIQAGWLAPGSHLDLIGSFAPHMIEAAPECFIGAGVWTDTPEAAGKAGDILNAVAQAGFDPASIVGHLEELCKGSCAARTSASQRTVFKAVGSALEDLVAAKLVYAGSGAGGRPGPA